MKKSLYITEIKRSLVYKNLISLLVLLPPACQYFRERVCFLDLSSLAQKGKMHMGRTAA